MELTEKERKQRENLRRIREFRLMDDIFMSKCFEDSPVCMELVLRIIMGKPDLKVLEVRTQKQIVNLLHRSLRMDAIATDSDGRKINVEVQRDDRGAEKERARFHSSMMDYEFLDKGNDFVKLPETYVIFITENDVLREGEALYWFERCNRKTGKPFGDGSHILYVNGSKQDDTPLGWLMHDFFCKEPAEMHYDALADRVRHFKEEKAGVDAMCKIMEDALKREREEAMEEVALTMLRAGKYALDEIANISRLPLDEIQRLRESVVARDGH